MIAASAAPFYLPSACFPERSPPSCGGDPLQRHKAANVVGQVPPRIIAVTSEIRTGQRQELFFEVPSIFTREIVEQRRLILPVWDQVTAQDVYRYSPILADRVAAQWSDGVEEVGRKLLVAIDAHAERIAPASDVVQ